jgi:hypothetical protein
MYLGAYPVRVNGEPDLSKWIECARECGVPIPIKPTMGRTPSECIVLMTYPERWICPGDVVIQVTDPQKACIATCMGPGKGPPTQPGGGKKSKTDTLIIVGIAVVGSLIILSMAT